MRMRPALGNSVIALALVATVSSPASIDARSIARPRGLILTGTLAEGSVPNRFSQSIDLVSGHNKHIEQMGESERQFGFDGEPWDEANGILTVSNLPAAIAREATKAWLDRRAWLERGREARRIVPKHGRSVDLEFDPATGLVKKATIAGDTGPILVTYGDWRQVGPYTYPFHRDEIEADGERTTIDVRSAKFVDALARDSLARPHRRSHAISLARGRSSVPFEETGRKSTHILVNGSVNGTPTKFIFDTGAANYLNSDAAPNFGVRVTGGVNIGGVGESSVTGGYATVDRVALGDAALRNEVFVVGPSFFPPAKPGAPPNPVGFTGFEFFAEYVTTIDYPTRQLHFATSMPKSRGGLTVPFYNDGSHIYVKGKIDGVEGLFGLDTGDGGTVMIFPDFASRGGLDQGDADVAISGGGAGGDVKASPGVVKRFSLGGLSFDQLPVDFSHQKAGAFASKSLAGNLGGGVLQCYSITIDFPHHLLLLDPAPENPHCKPGGTVTRS